MSLISYESLREIAEVVSLGGSIPAMALSILVLCCWLSATWEALKTQIASWKHYHWMIVGVFVGFFGGTGDSAFWFIPWTASFLEIEQTGKMIEFGVFPNIVLRQMADAVSAYCHVRSAIMYLDSDIITIEFLHRFCWLSVFLGVLYVAGLMVLKWIITNA